MVAADEAIGVGIHACGGPDGAALGDDRNAAREVSGVVAAGTRCWARAVAMISATL